MTKKLFISTIITFLLGIIVGVISYFNYRESVDKSFTYRANQLKLEKNIILFYQIMNNKDDFALKTTAKEILYLKRELEKFDSLDSVKLPTDLDSSIQNYAVKEVTGTVFSTSDTSFH